MQVSHRTTISINRHARPSLVRGRSRLCRHDCFLTSCLLLKFLFFRNPIQPPQTKVTSSSNSNLKLLLCQHQRILPAFHPLLPEPTGSRAPIRVKPGYNLRHFITCIAYVGQIYQLYSWTMTVVIHILVKRSLKEYLVAKVNHKQWLLQHDPAINQIERLGT